MAVHTSENRPIGDYGIIGNCRSAALISRDGSLDWLCLPRFDSPSYFAAILDPDRGGRFRVAPIEQFQTQRRYVGATNVLETTFTTASGQLRVTDVMAVDSEEAKRTELWPDTQIIRALECVQGTAQIEILCDPRPQYGAMVPKLSDRGALGFFYEHGSQVLVLRSDIPLKMTDDLPGLSGQATLRQGERSYLSVAFDDGHPAVLPPLGEEAESRIVRSTQWWEAWSGQCSYKGPFREEVLRSALTLKLMTYAPSGAIIASPTTSLPEQIGGLRNWDYRYCWLRDASLTLRALYDVGYPIEGQAFLSWLLDATRLTWPELQILYDVFGETHLKERELEHLQGYAGSRPVRVGNDAENQLQLDVYGEVVGAAYGFVLRGGRLDRATARVLTGLGKTVCRLWREPDEGIWEIRSGRRHHTHSKAMCWVALDRLLKLHDAGHIDVPVQLFSTEKTAIQQAIEARAYNEKLQSYVSTFDGTEVDASLLLLAIYGYAEPTSARMRATSSKIRERLGKNGLIYRYLGTEDGLPPGEGAFGICSFWSVECRALQGEIDQAMADFERIRSYSNDLQLFAEQIDPETGAALGNFPQAFTHVGLINAALTLAKLTGEWQPQHGEPDAEVRL
jgi:GH15 family glucan-1,4-alpha-glucosidase